MSARGVISTVAIAALGLVLLVHTPAAEGGFGPAFVVDTNIDDASKTGCLLATPNDCSLRGAIIRANDNNNQDDSTDSIDFSIGTAGNIPAIGLASALTAITEPVDIDGSTSPAGRVELAGSVVGGGFTIQAGDTRINRMVINRSPGNGITVTGTGNSNVTISNNRIGLHQTSNVTDQGNAGYGIEVIGNHAVTIENNEIGFNNRGIVITNSTGATTIRGNQVGMLASGADVGNDTGGILVQASGNVTIGGPAASDVNYVGGNTGSGISLTGIATGNVIQNNRIGINFHSTAVPNTSHGITGGTPGLQIKNNIISGNGMDGVRLNNAANVTLASNLIGLKSGGAVALPNGQDGVHVSGTASNIFIGTNDPTARNTISGNTQSGIEITATGPAALGAAGASQTGNIRIGSNRIGTNPDGTAKVANGADGVTVTGSTDVGIVANVISGNAVNGILINNSTDVAVQSNAIGTNALGTAALGNNQAGVRITGTSNGNLIGAPPDRNIISGNSVGVQIDSQAHDNAVLSNYIGLNQAGTGIVANGTGVRIDGFNNTIGESFSSRNVISGNSVGIEVRGITATNNTVHRNIVGLGPDEATPFGNKNAITIADGASSNVLWLNTVAGNTTGGIDIIGDTTVGNVLRRNLIYNNAGLGIDLGNDGVTPNDAGDADSGANHLQNFPVITEAWDNLHGGDDVVVLELDSKPNTQYTLTVHRNDACDASGHGEGQLPLEDADVTTDASGHAEVRIDMDFASWDVGDVVTATARDLNAGDTSEFSACFTVVTSPPGTATPTPVGATPTPTPSPTPVVTATPTSTATVTPTGTAVSTTSPPTGTVTFTPTLSETPTGDPLPGDVNCDGDVDEDDGSLLLLFAAGLSDGAQDPPCPDLGETPAGADFAWGDLNCDGAVDAIDALFLFAHVAGVELEAVGAACSPVG